MIRVENLTKNYGTTVAIDDISFQVEKGEIVGFLGPNGAGKTTTMRILTGFMPATAGRAFIGGHDVFRDSLPARRLIGYVPEGMPLYPEMRVREYLNYRARIKEVERRQRKSRVAECMERCGVHKVERKLIGQLSKGYRQRVGLADALLSDPPVLILDEPTLGLDPIQIRQVRSMIKNLGGDHTVLLSTHILPEVEMTCGRVLIINKGKLVLQDTPANVAQRRWGGGNLLLEVKGPPESVRAALQAIPGVREVSYEGGDPVARFTLKPEKTLDLREQVFRKIARNEWVLLEMRRETISLEDIFVSLTTEETS